MELNIGTNIKRLRLSKGLTQEQLADLLCISTPAVSKWEAKSSYPDIAMLFPLAQIFGVTVDELLGYDEALAKADVDEYLALHRKCEMNGQPERAREVICEARKKHPHDYRIMSAYMWDKAGGMADNDSCVLLENKDEFLQISNCILDDCKIESIRVEAMNMKAKLMHAEGDTKGALDLLSNLPGFYSQQRTEQLFSKDTEEYRFWNRKNFYGNMDVMAIKLARSFLFDDRLTLEEKIKRTEAVAEEFSRLSEKEDLECFCVAEEAVYGALLGYLSVFSRDSAIMAHMAEKQLIAMTKMIILSCTDEALKDCIEKSYGTGTDDLVGWMIDRWSEHPDEYFSKLKESKEYKALLEIQKSRE